MSSPVPLILASEDGPWTQMRTGTVVSQDASRVTVSVGGSQIPAMYGKGQTYNPGDLVVLLRQDATWAVLYAMAGAGPNEIQNPSFELSAPGLPPAGWLHADLTNLAQPSVGVDSTAPDGTQVAIVLSDAATSNSYLYSSAIAATAGEQFALSAYVRGLYDVDAPQTADAGLVALWFANTTDIYPTTSSADIVVDTAADVPSDAWSSLSGTVTAPVTGFLRVALRSTLSAGQALAWDLAIGRRLS